MEIESQASKDPICLYSLCFLPFFIEEKTKWSSFADNIQSSYASKRQNISNSLKRGKSLTY
jgi:hypothetical protein